MASSRQMSFWLAQFGIGGHQSSRLEGSPVNVIFSGGLMLAAILVLSQRRFHWGQFVQRNLALSVMYAFFLCSMLWSPFPVPTAKRVLLDFGCVLTGLVILSEREPAASLRVVFVRVSYILFPMSVIFMKYFPEIGRVISPVSGAQMMCGVTVHKNLLGQMTVVFCLVLLWDLMESRRSAVGSGTEPERWVRLFNLAIGLYLLVVSNSATSWIAFVLGLALLLAGRRLARMRNARRLFTTGVLAIVILFSLNQAFGVLTDVSETFERGPGLSGRTEIWRVTLENFRGSVVVGYGFRSFWETSDGEATWKELGTNQLLQSHNGYLEIYLHGGLVGLALLGVLLWATGRNAADKLVGGEPLGRMAVVLWPILLVINITEAQFFQLGSLWFTTLVLVIDSPWPVCNRLDARRGRHFGSTATPTTEVARKLFAGR